MTLYNQSLALLTDLYELTMAYGYWKAGHAEQEGAFHLTFRKRPFGGNHAIVAGLQTLIDFIENFRYSDTDLHYLSTIKDNRGKQLFENAFLDVLKDFHFACDIDAMTEGSLIFPYEPMIRVCGPMLQSQLLESPILNILNFQSLIATKASRVCQAASPDPVVEFGMRRAQGIDGAISATRASFIGGCESTSHVLGGKLYDIPVRGTLAHSWIMAFEEEEDAFRTFAEVMPHNCVLLIDTYDSIQGVKRAIKIAEEMKGKDFELLGVRLDSGDLNHLSIEVRKILDNAGYSSVKIMASNELDEYLIRDLKQQGSMITIWGVGTNLVTAKDQSALDGVYKLTAIKDKGGKWEKKIKISEQVAKTTNPGLLQVRRFENEGYYVGDVIYDTEMGLSQPCTVVDPLDAGHEMVIEEAIHFQDMLVPIFKKGKRVYNSPSLKEMQKHTQEELKKIKPSMLRFTNPQPYFAGIDLKLHNIKMEMIRKIREKM